MSEGGEHAEAEEATTGEHGGRLLEQDGFAVELAIAEDGTPPQYQAWFYEGGKPLPATAGSVEVTTDAPGRRRREPHAASRRPTAA